MDNKNQFIYFIQELSISNELQQQTDNNEYTIIHQSN